MDRYAFGRSFWFVGRALRLDADREFRLPRLKERPRPSAHLPGSGSQARGISVVGPPGQTLPTEGTPTPPVLVADGVEDRLSSFRVQHHEARDDPSLAGLPDASRVE